MLWGATKAFLDRWGLAMAEGTRLQRLGAAGKAEQECSLLARVGACMLLEPAI